MPNGNSPTDDDIELASKDFLIKHGFICGRNFASARMVAKALTDRYPGQTIERMESRAIAIAKARYGFKVNAQNAISASPVDKCHG